MTPVAFAQVNLLEKIKNKPATELQTRLSFQFIDAPDFELQENLKNKILILKIRNAQVGDIPNLIVFKDPLLGGVRIRKINDFEHWALIRTKHPNLLYKVVPQKRGSSKLVLQFNRKVAEVQKDKSAEVVEMFRELNPGSERLIITLDKPAQYDIIRDNTQPGGIIKIRMLSTKATAGLIVPGASTKMIKFIKHEQRGKYLLFSIKPENFVLNIDRRVVTKPEHQIILSFTEDKTKDVSKLMAIAEEKKKAQAQANQAEVQREQFIEKKFEEAEYELRLGHYAAAGLLFKNIYNFSPHSGLGVRAAFRSGDAYYQSEKLKDPEKEIPDHDFVVQEYRAAIDAALTADLGYDDVPRAYYNMGKMLLSKKIYGDAFNMFEIILQLHPDSPYSKDALFQKGVIHLAMYRYEKSIETLQDFITENQTARQLPLAYYKLGEAQFQQKQFKEAKQNFDKAWSMNGDYMKTDAELMFHMGEAYYENKNYQTARSIYENLLDLYPDEAFSNLVAIRIGDFLRAEDKIEDAIKAYEKAIVEYSNELLLIGKMRIANIYAEKPEKDEYKKALEIYDFIIEKYYFSDQIEEATLRKGLTLGLFQHYPESINTLEKFCKDFPKNIYVKNRIIQSRIIDNVRSYIKDYYDQGLYLDALAVWEKYEKKYYLRPQSSACYVEKKNSGFGEKIQPIIHRAPLFLIADSYFRLGLQDKSLVFLDEIIKAPKDPLAPLAWFNKGRIFDVQDKSEQSQQVYMDWLVKYPNHTYTPTVKKAFGDAYYKVHKFDRVDKAIRIYNQTIRDYQETDNPMHREIIVPCHFALGGLYQAIGKYDDSIDSYKKVIATYEHPLQDQFVEPIVVDTHYILGDLFFELNALPEALSAYNEAIELFPNSEKTPWAKYQKGQIFVKYNQKEKALAIFEELMEEAKDQPDALWGALSVESHKAMVNDLRFDQWLGREAKPN